MKYDDIPEVEGFKKLPLGKARNLYGEKFNRLAPIYRTEELTGSQRCAYWLCKCTCGNYYITRASSLVNGSTQSCGCYNKDAVRARSFVDIAGQRFGRLTAIKLTTKRSENIKSTARYWLCKCDCGNETVVSYSCLVTGKTISCGCINREKAAMLGKLAIHDLTGQQFEYLTVIKQDLTPGLKRVHWICKCKCGNMVSVAANSLTEGRTLSCGCYGSSRGEKTIAAILKQNQIRFKKEIAYDNLIDKRKLRFDFGVYTNKHLDYLIEYDGIQHFQITGGRSNLKQFALLQKHDQMKNQYCKDNNIPLIRIPYTAHNTLCIDDLRLETTKYRVA